MKRLIPVKAIAAGIIGAACLLAPHADAAPIFMEIPGIPGESQAMPGAIDVAEFEFDAVALDRSGRRPNAPDVKGVVESQTMHVVKRIDKSTPLLYRAMCDGSVGGSVVLTWGDPHEGVGGRYKLTDVMISSYSTSGENEKGTALETYELSFSKMVMQIGTLSPDGKVVYRDAASGLPTGRRQH